METVDKKTVTTVVTEVNTSEPRQQFFSFKKEDLQFVLANLNFTYVIIHTSYPRDPNDATKYGPLQVKAVAAKEDAASEELSVVQSPLVLKVVREGNEAQGEVCPNPPGYNVGG